MGVSESVASAPVSSTVRPPPLSGRDDAFGTHYDLGAVLGKGSQGVVHACTHRKSGKQYAVKVMDYSTSRNAWQTYRREIDLCKMARALHVIAVLAEFADVESCYVVMKRFAGHLRKCLKWTANQLNCPRLDEGALRSFARQGLSAIAYLHEQTIAHRDVKAHNFFVDRLDLRNGEFRVVLGDLGLAKRLEPGRCLSSQVGTRKYWAPELYNRMYWHAVDVFALGVTLFLAATLEYPFVDEAHTQSRDVAADGGVPDGLSLNARDLLLRMLIKDPYSRPSAAESQCHPWFWGHLELESTELTLPDVGTDCYHCRHPPGTLAEAMVFQASASQALAGAFSVESAVLLREEPFYFNGAYSGDEIMCNRVSWGLSCWSCMPTAPVCPVSKIGTTSFGGGIQKRQRRPRHPQPCETTPVVEIVFSDQDVTQQVAMRTEEFVGVANEGDCSVPEEALPTVHRMTLDEALAGATKPMLPSIRIKTPPSGDTAGDAPDVACDEHAVEANDGAGNGVSCAAGEDHTEAKAFT